MRTLLAAVVLLSGCSTPLTPEQRAQRHVQQIEQLIARFGPACSSIGHQEASKPWADCVVMLASEEQAESAGQRAIWAQGLQGFRDGYSAQQRCRWIGQTWTCW